MGIEVRDELIDEIIKEASQNGVCSNSIIYSVKEVSFIWIVLIFIWASKSAGREIMEEADFLQWITRVSALQDEHESATSSKNSSTVDDKEDAARDLIAAFRSVIQLWIFVCIFYREYDPFSCSIKRVFDRDGNGFITRDELRIAMEMMQETVTETQVNEMLQIADLDKDGKINYEGIRPQAFLVGNCDLIILSNEHLFQFQNLPNCCCRTSFSVFDPYFEHQITNYYY